jgi:guanine nucleotide exchange factor VAV
LIGFKFVENQKHKTRRLKVYTEIFKQLLVANNALQFSQKVSASTANFEQRDFVIKELLETETNYLEVLNALKYKFMQPMEKYLAKEEIKTIFPTIKVSRQLYVSPSS